MTIDRRSFLAAGAATAAGTLVGRAEDAIPLGRAEHCVMVWLGGGAAQIDTWDPKRLGDAKAGKPGSYYPAIDTAVRGVQVCEHLPRCAAILDRFALLRTVHHDVIDEHAAATNRMHTGRRTAGTIVYPSVGSVVAHCKGRLSESVPPYVLIGYPNVTRGPGFLGAAANSLYLTDTQAGPPALRRPESVTARRRRRRERLLARMRSTYRDRTGGSDRVVQYDRTVAESLRLAGPEFAGVFDLDREPADLRSRYGGEFGQRCLLTRRLIERGVRFVEVSHNLNFLNGTGWDTHREGQLTQHLLIDELDRALSTLVLDLEAKKLLDRTVVMVASEFGRPAGFDAQGGRGHQGSAFTVVMAGGGLRTGRVVGATDDLSKEIFDRPISVPDWHATAYAALGIDPSDDLYDGDRPVPITDGGQPLPELLG